MTDQANTPDKGPVGRMPMPLQEAMENYFCENASFGAGDIRTEVTLEALQRRENADSWTIGRRKMGRVGVMELLLQLVSDGWSMPAILKITGMPRPITVMRWTADYKVFRDLMEVAEGIRAEVLADQALEIADDTKDDLISKNAVVRAKLQVDLRLRLAESFNNKRFGKKQAIDVTTHTEDLSDEEAISRLSSFLKSHAQTIEAKTGIKVIAPVIDAEITDEAPGLDLPQKTLGMEGQENPIPDFTDELTFPEGEPNASV